MIPASHHLTFGPASNQDILFRLSSSRGQNLPTLNDLLVSNQWAMAACATRSAGMQPNVWQESFAVNNMPPIAFSQPLSGSSSDLARTQASLYFMNSHLQQMQRLSSPGSPDISRSRSQPTNFAHASPPAEEPSTPSHASRGNDSEFCPSSPSWARSPPASESSSSGTGANKIFPRRKAGQAFRVHSKPVVLNEKVLRQYFDLPLHEAAVQLGISATAMKSACRKCGISKWPYRTVTAKSSAGGAPRPRPAAVRTPPSSAFGGSGSGSGSGSDDGSAPPSPALSAPACGPAGGLPPLSPTDACSAATHFAAAAAAPPLAAASSPCAAAALRRALSVPVPVPAPPPRDPSPARTGSGAGSLWAILN